MRLVKKKGNTKAKVDVEKFLEVVSSGHQKCCHYGIPAELVINWDQTGLSYISLSEWTMEKEGPI